MANIPALAGYQNANGEVAPAKFGVSDVMTDPNGNILMTAGAGGLLVVFDTPFLVVDYTNTVYNGAIKGTTWSFTSAYAFKGILDLSALSATPIPSGATAVYLGCVATLWNTLGGAARAINVCGAKTIAQLPSAVAIPSGNPYHIVNVGGGSAGGEYDSGWGTKIISLDGDRLVSLCSYCNNSPNGVYWYISVLGYKG